LVLGHAISRTLELIPNFFDSVRDVARHGLVGGGWLKPPKQKYSPPNEMKPISPFGLGLLFFSRFVSTNLINVFISIFDHLKDPAAGGILCVASKCFGSNFSRN